MNTSIAERSRASAGELVGRGLLALLFIIEAWSKLLSYGAVVDYLAAHGLSPLLLPLVIIVELGGGIMILLGWQTRIAAVALAVFCVLAAVVIHRNFSDRNQLIHFEKDLALAGAFLILWVRGAGALSLDVLRERRRFAATESVSMRVPVAVGRPRAGHDDSRQPSHRSAT